ncbi:MAG: hypothetical protein M3P43_03750 [Actinomycetota bacterium]|nr:hypothetical protein [Actinomycetota bacterium]
MDVVPPPPEQDAPPAAPTQGTRPPGDLDHRTVTIVTIVACVAIIAVIGGAMAIAGGGGDASSATPTAPSPAAVAAPQTMDAHPAAFVVVLTWAQGEGLPVSYYAVTRDGRPITTVSPTTTTWIDRSVTPETRYVYTVAAVGADGTRAVTRVIAKTPTAPLSTARFQGTFNVHLHATSHFGFSNFHGENQTAGWRSTPTCRKGPCDTKVADLHGKAFVVTLTRSGAAYEGTVSVSGIVKCAGADVTSTFTVSVHATDAGAVRDSWVVTKVQGTMTQREAAQLGCIASGATYSVNGSLVH